jgi:phosphatidate cytidylyltransferase
MKWRVITSVIGVPFIVIVCLIETLLPIRVFAILLGLLMLLEVDKHETRGRSFLLLFIAVGLVVLAFVSPFGSTAILWMVVLGLACLIWPLLFDNYAAEIRTIGWIVIPLVFVIQIRSYDLPTQASWSIGGGSLLLLLFFCIWSGDTAAFFVGRSLGKLKLAPEISPGKTWEGACANFVASAMVGGFAGPYLGLPMGLCIKVGLFVGVVGQIGDLYESYWKRQLGIKDSGVLLPGHGGVLDRFDSLLFSVYPVVMALPL